MNTKRFILANIAVFVFIFLYEWLFHGVCLSDIYMETASLWRPEADMGEYFKWLTLGQLLFSIMFCFIFLKGYENKGIMEGVRYGALIGILFIAPNLIFYAVQPLPATLVIYWSIGGLIEIMIAGALLASIYKPSET